VSELHLPSLLAQDADTLAAAIVERHGGRGAMNAMDLEIVAGMVRTFNAMRAAAPADLPALVSSLSKLEQMLPSPVGRSLSALDQLNAHIAATHAVS
jgi:hypothetical protein